MCDFRWNRVKNGGKLEGDSWFEYYYWAISHKVIMCLLLSLLFGSGSEDKQKECEEELEEEYDEIDGIEDADY